MSLNSFGNLQLKRPMVNYLTKSTQNVIRNAS